MQITTDVYKTILRRRHRKEIKISIDGVEYGEESIVFLRTFGGLYEDLSIGNAPSRQIELGIYPKGNIPKRAEIDVYLRLTDGEQNSEWIPKGVFFFSTRETDAKTGVMTINGYDAMLKSEQVWLNSSYDSENWPMQPTEAVNDIASRMGVGVDERTTLNGQYLVGYPVDGTGEMTMRAVLKRIAIANAGNWCITDDGKLLLVHLASIPQETRYLVSEHGDSIVLGNTRIIV